MNGGGRVSRCLEMLYVDHFTNVKHSYCAKTKKDARRVQRAKPSVIIRNEKNVFSKYQVKIENARSLYWHILQ